ncbi:MAG: hypothetical protein Q4D55_02670 [Eubacteriales bacterium]|nr:hypothetical protein [Eubacteriales bacterium]
MAKVLKFIVHLVVICTILCVVALAVPPFFGVTTEIRDKADEVSNLPMGSVTYAIPVKSTEMAVGDAILVQYKGGTSRYNISTLDVASNSGTAVDSTISQPIPANITVGEYMPKVVITISVIGYLMIATQSIEGLIILGLAVLFLIILYVIAELWKKDPEDDEDYPQDTAPGYVKSKKELKQEERRRERRFREEERQLKAEEKPSKKKKKSRTVRTGGFVDEIDEEDLEEEDDEMYLEEEDSQATVQTATSEAHEVLKKEIAAATAEGEAPVRKKKVSQETTRVVVKKKAPIPDITEESEEDEVPEIKRMAIPRMTAAQLAKKAKKAGDSPDIVRDEVTKVTLLDYSDIFAEDEDEEYEEEE